MRTTIGGDIVSPRIIQTSYSAEDLEAILAIHESAHMSQALKDTPLSASLTNRIGDGVMQLMRKFSDADYNSEAGRWQLLTMLRWLLRPEQLAKDLQVCRENTPPTTHP
jgi:hypothetical protein